ncbi:hypothetical protein [Bacteroides sp.]|uniref:hypothetical protein n=1 Tax=Bacteroides sp. TaxID=29523 RepID=UPI0031FC376D
MSSFETIKRANPYGIEDDVLKLTIDSAEDSYRLPNLITEPDTYVFVIWHRTDTPCTISFDILGETVTSESSSQWTKVVKVKKVTDLSNKNIDITPPVNSTTYYYEAYLARGSVDTSWTPAPEDNIEDIIGLKSEIKQTAERIDLTVGNLQGQLAELSIRADNITSRVESVEGTTTLHSSQITQIPEQITQQVNDAKKELSAQIKLQSDEIVHTVGKNHATAIRYIRDWLNGSNLDTQNRWAEINVMSNNENIASGIIPVCKNEEENNVSVSYLERYTDGDTSKYIESTSGWKCLQLDLGQVRNDVDYITVWHEYPLTSDPSSVSKIFNHRLQVSSDGKVWFTLYDSRYQQSGGYKETPNGKTHYINDTSINDTFSSVQQKIDGITTTIQNVEENLKTEINESANGFNVNIQRISQDLENAKSALNNAIDSLNTSFNVELGKITGIIEGIDEETNQKISSAIQQSASGWQGVFKKYGMFKDGTSVKQLNVNINGDGIEVLNPGTSRSTKMNTQGFEGWFNGNKVFWMQEDATKTSRVYADRGVELPTLKMIPLTVQDSNSITRNGIAFVKTGGSS